MLAIQKLHLLNFGHNLLTSNDLVRQLFRLLHNRSSQWQHRRPDCVFQSGSSRHVTQIRHKIQPTITPSRRELACLFLRIDIFFLAERIYFSKRVILRKRQFEVRFLC